MVRFVSRSGPEVASMRRRALAGLLDLLTILAVFAAWLATVVWRHRRGTHATVPRSAEGSRCREVTEFVQSRRGQRVVWGAFLLLVGIPLRNSRGPGARITGIQIVDVRSGGPVTVRSAVLGAFVDALWRRLIRRLMAPVDARSDANRARRQALEPQLSELLRPHAGDGAAQMKIREELYKAHDIPGESQLLWRVASAFLMPLTSLLSPRRQTIRQRLTGTLIIRAR
jgi:hypothetical protein